MQLNGENRFWQFNIGHLLTLLSFLVIGVGGYFKMDARLTAVELLSGANSSLVEKINAGGTAGSRDQATRDALRIDLIEQQMRLFSSKLDKIDVNLVWVMDKYRTEKRQ